MLPPAVATTAPSTDPTIIDLFMAHFPVREFRRGATITAEDALSIATVSRRREILKASVGTVRRVDRLDLVPDLARESRRQHFDFVHRRRDLAIGGRLRVECRDLA